MNELFSENCNLEEVVQAIKDRRVLNFSDIPLRHQNGDTAKVWLGVLLSYGFENPDRYYQEVPDGCRTDEFLRYAVTAGCSVLRDITPSDTNIYGELVRLSVGANRFTLKHVDPAFRDEDLLEDVFKRYFNQMRSLIQDIDWIAAAMSDDLLDRCCKRNFLIALDFPIPRIEGDIGRYLDLEILNGEVIKDIRKKGWLDLISAKVGAGIWPLSISGKALMKKPSSMDQALILLEGSEPGSAQEAMYMACLMREPVEQVLLLMASNRLKKLLLEMYSPEALAPHLKSDLGLRGVMLEDAMGL
jgi:hypothetical protein